MNCIIISIIIATFNSEKTLRNALESVRTQISQNWECIIVDGASKDSTIDIVEEFERRDSRFWHISEPDNGIYDAFNKGWRMAKGKWIYFLGSDDTVLPDGLNKLLLGSWRADIVYGDMMYLTGFAVRTKKSIQESKLVGNMPCHQSMMMKRELIELLNGFNQNRYKICADFDLFQRALNNGAKVHHVASVIACFNSLGMSSGIDKYMKECFCIKREYSGLLSAILYVMSESIKRFTKNILLKIKKSTDVR